MLGGYLILGCATAVLVLGIVLLARRSEVFALLTTVVLFLLATAAWFAQTAVAPVTLMQLLQPRGNPAWWLSVTLTMVIPLYLYERKRKTQVADSDEEEVWYWLLVPLLEVILGAFLLPVIISPLVTWLAPDARGLPEWVGDERGRVTFFIAGMVVNGIIAIILLPLRGPLQMAYIVYVALATFGMVFNFGVPVALVLYVGTHMLLKLHFRRSHLSSGMLTS